MNYRKKQQNLKLENLQSGFQNLLNKQEIVSHKFDLATKIKKELNNYHKSHNIP